MKVVLDASAGLALLRDEPGAEIINEVITGAIMSTANYTEVVSRLVATGVSDSEDEPNALTVADTLVALGITLAPVDPATAAIAGLMFSWSRAYGLSLGDRLCLATAEGLRTADQPVTVYTSDQAWNRIPSGTLSVAIRQIR